MEGRISTLTLLCLMLSGVGAVTVDIPKDLYEYARGDNITLPCTFKPKPGFTPAQVIISWSAQETLILTHYYPEAETDITSDYEGRVSLDVDVKKGKANLNLSSISLADNVNFECRLQIRSDDEGKPADYTRLVVLVAPSKPICKIQGKAEYGQNINLTCLSEEGSPTPTYKWESRDVSNVPRIPDPRTTDKGGILSLYNISKETSGYYICTSSNKIRTATCNITLAVMPPSMNIGSTAGIIGGVVFLIILLLIICICCYCCRKKKKEEEYAMGVREEEYSDKEPARNGESRHADGQEDTRGYEDSRARSPVRQSDHYEERSERDYDDRRSDYDDRRSDYSDRRDKYSDRHERYDGERHYDDDRRYDDRKDRGYDDERYDDRERDRPPVPANKPPRRDYDN
ncbi:cell surface A33 antigen-like [Morone saxatilis]|uniref:cell surface A33 antigen-like n=1 Tax=Morone saxatilis TaxID=34816 RepID=UPI0015E2131E|nr:cell surface A33 antigen-like [Morone saxatilis]